ncbi:ferritin-like domain-containing protein [Actinomadura rupiterrae]|uniref:ferritin-like domain-containing protein n=1 Tax=Actinomadura rupiterrae TaxID=559627 RepID=UPI0020A30CB0|nr:ferritin-like domain-containing protein [Actinomadura rupiterrae]MCP2339099.1 ferritin-like protein [Actinomadura rupiterrae]
MTQRSAATGKGTMVRIARDIVERSGVDVPALIAALTDAARAELSDFYRYGVLAAHPLAGIDGPLREILQDVRTEDRHHFDALAARICELEGRLPDDLFGFVRPAPPPAVLDPLAELLAAERRAVETYSRLCERTAGRDHRTHDLVRAILNEKLEHRAWFAEYAGAEGAAPPRFRPGFRGRSPYLPKTRPDAPA